MTCHLRGEFEYPGKTAFYLGAKISIGWFIDGDQFRIDDGQGCGIKAARNKSGRRSCRDGLTKTDIVPRRRIKTRTERPTQASDYSSG